MAQNKEYQAQYRRDHREKSRAWSKKYADTLRANLIWVMGGKCCKCGFDDPRALQVDHVFGGGNKERSLVKSNLSAKALAKKIEQFRQGKTQLLCANCNWIKRVTHHELKKA